ncbi:MULTISPECIES: GntR family transcriptional regulator [Romboutsia]|uniref:Transcriptional regulator, GntR n=2 Tax=Romboutsia hominis TaxID=1507512 RepID=A0A2P2BSE9_9FIRM|nr:MULTISPECIES: GntR family transcriptional regulator [Romboutsia]MDB8790287.1 GntR family transcriptional regulator [Romboutsia sp. 1001216sp1]MDB8794925.1 GntR family transcriptional regulator [Romboutsia sp. 1001216sp1]MDB8794927.1 GntR family transcriptional regulator [Romboutsia sp. 1001216sp1]MDB8798738.1 GntR family transcriptional regulator [Romboutsia sp. 1001216sp1]MDB8801534.1 GntR family transcriptional regulator [Romboutsia sp. 1001216sp1]
MILYEKKYKETGKEYAYRILKDNIMSLELKPGELLSESDLSEKLNISRTPIREVLMKLKNEHLIEVKPQSGTYVSLMDSKIIDEAIFMRSTIEKEVLKEACEYFPEDLFIELEKNLFAQKLLCDIEGKEIEFHNLDKKFHRLIFLGCNKINIWDSIMNISTHYNRMRLLSEMKTNRNKIISQHEEMLNIIKNKEVDKIDDYIQKHIVLPAKEWRTLIKDNDDVSIYFK